MLTRPRLFSHSRLRTYCSLLVVALLVAAWTPCFAGFARVGAVGGVFIDTEGLLRNPTVAETKKLIEARQEELAPADSNLEQASKLRKISLRRLNEAIANHRASKVTPLPEEIQLLGGLQRIDYIFVYPEQNDVVIAGPAEAWKVNQQGDVVGATANRPVMQLDDLLIALRYSHRGPIQCSIDPTAKGLTNLRKLAADLARSRGVNPAQAAGQIEQVLGPQVITIGGVPEDSHFARVLVAADYQMKRLAMNFEPAPVKGLPSFLHLTSNPSGNMLPRWWLAPQAKPLLASPDGLSWHVQGLGVQCKTEEDFVNKDGTRTRTGNKGGPAQRWADNFTEKYEELSSEMTIFGQLRNVINLAVVGAVIAKENMFERAGMKPLYLLSEEPTATFNTPKQVATQASVLRKGRGWLISASGGVQMYPAELVADSEKDEQLSIARQQATAGAEKWWWD